MDGLKVQRGGAGVSSLSESAIAYKPIGSVVKLNVGGQPREFIVLRHGLPDLSTYDMSCNGTWLIMKDIYESRAWHSSASVDYAGSDIHNYLNTTFLGLFDSSIQSKILDAKIPYDSQSAMTTSFKVKKGSDGLSAKIFLPSWVEVENGRTSSSLPPEEGVWFNYFGDSASRLANLNGVATIWWLRSPCRMASTGSYGVGTVNAKGGTNNYYTSTSSYGIRPALIVPMNLKVSEDGFVG